ncbi:unnamed protein product [Protopolystoma xenopodis]|uniref:Nuclear receptor domain-containing protein n=1 Tax=Protopolystoma xenopodis TaxID=117903 RepID=A0A448XNC0_9PLAT|nr:unnamed protein product [Protopolystoma xenopodis]
MLLLKDIGNQARQCTNNRRCLITVATRNRCQYCRLRRCLDLGMSRRAARLGRRPRIYGAEGSSAKFLSGSVRSLYRSRPSDSQSQWTGGSLKPSEQSVDRAGYQASSSSSTSSPLSSLSQQQPTSPLSPAANTVTFITPNTTYTTSGVATTVSTAFSINADAPAALSGNRLTPTSISVAEDLSTNVLSITSRVKRSDYNNVVQHGHTIGLQHSASGRRKMNRSKKSGCLIRCCHAVYAF